MSNLARIHVLNPRMAQSRSSAACRGTFGLRLRCDILSHPHDALTKNFMKEQICLWGCAFVPPVVRAVKSHDATRCCSCGFPLHVGKLKSMDDVVLACRIQRGIDGKFLHASSTDKRNRTCQVKMTHCSVHPHTEAI